jgi:diacylglycerol O-acyltransferase / wax synthase
LRQAVWAGRQGPANRRALSRSLEAATSETGLNEPISPGRHLAPVQRPLADLKQIKQRFGTAVNDVVLAVAAGGLRRFLERGSQAPVKLKAMVPVSVRENGRAGQVGNRISFLYVDLPCDEPTPCVASRCSRLRQRKQGGEPQGADAMLKVLGYAPRQLQRAVSRMVASPRAFNLVVSKIPGPPLPLFMLGCELEEVYPVVPLTDQHAV